MRKKLFNQKWLPLFFAVLLFLPSQVAFAKYSELIHIGSLHLSIKSYEKVLDQNWKEVLTKLNFKPSALVIGSYNDNSDMLGSLTWDQGTYVGVKSGSDFTGGVKLFMVNDTAYILAEKDNKVIFPEDSSYLFAASDGTTQSGTAEVQKYVFGNVDTSEVINMSYMFAYCRFEAIDLSSFDTGSVVSVEGIFKDNTALKTITLGDKFNCGSRGSSAMLPAGEWYIGTDTTNTISSDVLLDYHSTKNQVITYKHYDNTGSGDEPDDEGEAAPASTEPAEAPKASEESLEPVEPEVK